MAAGKAVLNSLRMIFEEEDVSSKISYTHGSIHQVRGQFKHCCFLLARQRLTR